MHDRNLSSETGFEEGSAWSMDRMDDERKYWGVSSREKGNMLYGDFLGIIFLHVLANPQQVWDLGLKVWTSPFPRDDPKSQSGFVEG